MKIHTYPPRSQWASLCTRPAADNAGIKESVQKIIDDVKRYGDKALKKYTEKFDGVKIQSLAVTDEELNNAEKSLTKELIKAVHLAKKNIEKFHAVQKEPVQKTETMPGVVCWRKSVGIERIGIYIPGGSAPLFSTVLMLAAPAQLAGCREIILCTPPDKSGNINPAILYAARICGIKKIYKTGGAQAVAAMAYGTATIPQVYKIFGPGNQYVTMAKQLLQQTVAIDMPAGPSEVLIIADETAVLSYVAADLLSQAEHGPDSQVMLVTTEKCIAENIMNEIKIQTASLPRKKIAEAALKNSKCILVKNTGEAVAFSNMYAPEHLILACNKSKRIAGKIISAGSVFIGNYSPESAGDYASGTNHTLPTNGWAAAYSGVSLDSFVKKITFQRLSKKGLKNISSAVMAMAEAEQLMAHKNAIAIRLKK